MKRSFARCAAVVVAAVVLLYPAPAYAKRKAKPAKGAGRGEFVRVDMDEPGFEGMYYTVFVPDGVRKGETYPLVFALHGNGAKSDGHARTIAQVSTAEHPVFVCAPQYQKGTKFNDPRYEGWDRKFHEILDTLVAEYPIDSGRLFLQGFSMGAMYSCMWTHGSHAGDPAKFRFQAVWLNGTAAPPRKPAPDVPYLLMVGERETAVIGTLNLTKQTRECYRIMFARGFDVRYLEIPGMGHAVNGDCIQIMRDFVAGYPGYGGSIPPDLKVPGPLQPAVDDCRRGRFWKAFDLVKDVRSIGSGASTGERAAAGRIVRSAEAWLKTYAAGAVKRIEGTRSPYQVDALVELSDLLAGNDTVGPALKAARAKLSKSKKLEPELEAREQFERAQRTFERDRSAAGKLLAKLAKGSLAKTVFGRRAAEHLQAMSDEYWSE